MCKISKNFISQTFGLIYSLFNFVGRSPGGPPGDPRVTLNLIFGVEQNLSHRLAPRCAKPHTIFRGQKYQVSSVKKVIGLAQLGATFRARKSTKSVLKYHPQKCNKWSDASVETENVSKSHVSSPDFT